MEESKVSEIEKFLDLKMWIQLGMFVLAIGGAIGSYFKTTSEIQGQIQLVRQDLSQALVNNSEKIRSEIKDQYATKESANFVNMTLQEIKGDLKEIKGKIDAQGRK